MFDVNIPYNFSTKKIEMNQLQQEMKSTTTNKRIKKKKQIK